jgi:hypothetical protein
VVGVLSPPLEPQAAVKSTTRAGIIGIAFEAYYSKISQMPAASKVDACNAAAAWAGQCCKCRFELDGKELEEEEADSFGSVSPMSSEAENGKELEDELARMRINGDSGGRNCSEEDKEARVPLPWELLQPVVRVLGHCLLAPLNPGEVRDAAAEAVRVVYARACHDLLPQAILAARSLIELDKSAQRWRLLGKLLQLALLEAMRQALGQVQSQTHQASSGSLTHYSCPNKVSYATSRKSFCIW